MKPNNRHNISVIDTLWGSNPDEREILFPKNDYVENKNEVRDEK